MTAPRNRPRIVTIAIVVCLAAYGTSQSFLPAMHPGHHLYPPFGCGDACLLSNSLGAEYYSIATSLVHGRGFSGPFRMESGPTAWMLPLYSLGQAALLQLFDNHEGSFRTSILILNGAGICIALLWFTHGRQWLWAPGLMVVIVIGHHTALFQLVSDGWFLMLLAVWQWRMFVDMPRRPAAVNWGVCGGLIFLANASLALGWCWLTLLALPHLGWRRWGIVFTIVGLIFCPWLIRNRVVFGHWIPFKSNMRFEFYQSLMVDDDGVLNKAGMIEHPFRNYDQAVRHAEVGELQFVRQSTAGIEEYALAHPGELARRMTMRVAAVSLVYYPFQPECQNAVWLSIVRVLYAVPGLAALVCLVNFRRIDWETRCALGLLAIYFLPYTLISFYERYTVPMLLMKYLVCHSACQIYMAQNTPQPAQPCRVITESCVLFEKEKVAYPACEIH